MALNARRQRFVDEYLKDLNATQAAIRAGFSAKTAEQAGHRLLRNVEIAAEIAQKQQERQRRVQVDQDYVLNNLTEVVERTMQRAPVMEFDREAKEYVQAKDAEGRDIWEFDARSSVAALQLLAKHTGGFVDRHEHTGPKGGPINVLIRREGKRLK